VEGGERAVRMGLCYVKGLREEAGRAIVRAREELPFTSVDGLTCRVPELRKDEVSKLASVGALNWIGREARHAAHRRDRLWEAGRAARPSGPLLEGLEHPVAASPLERMTDRERLIADFCGTGLTVGPHPMSYARAQLHNMGVCRAADLAGLPDGRWVRVAGGVIVRQRPGTAKGFVFLSLEDETGIANAIVTPDLFDRDRFVLIHEPFLMVEGVLQNQDNVVSVRARRLLPLTLDRPAPASHDFR
jgi:error-prone DNA polymerase